MKTKINFLTSFIVFLSVISLSSCSSVDKNKCTDIYIVEKIDEIYDKAFGHSNYGMGNVDLGLENCASKQLKEILTVKNDILLENSIPNFFTGYDLSMNMEYKNAPNDPILGSQEELVEIAKQGKTLDVPYYFEYRIFYNNGRYKQGSGSVTIQLIYEDSDWVIDNIIYEKSAYKSLRDNLNRL